jgi:hypothetical protein
MAMPTLSRLTSIRFQICSSIYFLQQYRYLPLDQVFISAFLSSKMAETSTGEEPAEAYSRPLYQVPA